MIDKIVVSSEPIGLVGGGPVSQAQLADLKTRVRRVVAADSGADDLHGFGWQPDAVIGDMDSIDAQTRAALPDGQLHPIAEQDSTDFEKCLMRISAPIVLALGFRGGRVDHELAAFHGLLRFAEARCILISPDDIVFLCPPKLTLDLPTGTPVSLFPLAPVTGRTAGLAWSFEALDYAPGGRIGTSNHAAGLVEIDMPKPAMLCIMPIDVLDAVVTQLAAQPGSWPARV